MLQVDCIKNKELNDEKNLQTVLRPELDMNREEQMAINDFEQIINRSENNTKNASKDELYFLLVKGILIDNGEKVTLHIFLITIIEK